MQGFRRQYFNIIINFLFFFQLKRLYIFKFQIEIHEFQKIVKSFTEKFDEISGIVEKEKIKVSLISDLTS